MATSHTQKVRISSIDALRAITLLGILIVHANNGFGLTYEPIIQSFWDPYLVVLNDLFLVGKCNTIFAVLFGVSFYLILRNPKNSNAKFIWRCFLLVLIGLFNKFFYTYDALMWYGLWGMVLVFFRQFKPKYLLIVCCCLILISDILAKFKLGDDLFGETLGTRYGVDKSFIDVVTYPNAVADYLHVVLNGSFLGTVAKFIFGYWIAKIGFIENIQKRLTKFLLLFVLVLFFALFSANFLLDINDRHNGFIRVLSNYSASIAYASALLYAYYHLGFCNRILRLFEPYGRLGLTNYSMGGILGVVFMNDFGLGLYKYGVSLIVIFFIVFFLLQTVFSYYWLRYFTYGPMEYIWRVATERKLIPFLREH